MARETPEKSELDPEEFLRALLRIGPEDAAEVREDAAKRDRASQQETHRDDEGQS